MSSNKNKGQSGFTLIELLVVIAIIALMASIVVVALSDARIKSRDARRLGDMRQVLSGMELYFNDKTAYPTGTASVAAGGAMLGLVNTMDNPVVFTPTYMIRVPTAPIPYDGSCSSAGKGGNNYWYETNTLGSTYTITFCLGQTTSAGLGAGTHTISPAGLR